MYISLYVTSLFMCLQNEKRIQQKYIYSAIKYFQSRWPALSESKNQWSRWVPMECFFATVYTRLSFPQWNLKIVLLSLSNPLSVLWRFRILFSIRNVLVFHKPLQSGHRLKFRFDLVRLIFRWFYLSWKFRLLREREIRQPYLDSHSGIQQTKKRQYLESHRNISSKPDQVCNN